MAVWVALGLATLPFLHLAHAAAQPAAAAGEMPGASDLAVPGCGAGMACAQMRLCRDAARVAKAAASGDAPRPPHLPAVLLALRFPPAGEAVAGPTAERGAGVPAPDLYLATERLRL